jgi:hypothetical protein
VPALAVLREFAGLVGIAALAIALVAAVAATRGRDRRVLVLAAGALGWVLVVAIMAQAGYAGRARYSAPAAAVACALAGAGVAELAGWARWPRSPATAAAVLAALLLAATGLARAHELRVAVADVQRRAAVARALEETIARAGGAPVLRACPWISSRLQSAVAWELEVPIARVHREPRAPGVVMRHRDPEEGWVPVLGRAGARALGRPVRAGDVEVRAACDARPLVTPG